MRTAVINVVGLSESCLGEHTPELNKFRQSRALARIRPAFPAVTCTAQSNYLTGKTPASHGIVGNGWYNREMADVQFWKQSNHLVRGRKLWEEIREAKQGFKTAKLFWWYNMYSTAEITITPRPMYPADGRKVFDVYTWPFNVRSEIKKNLGEFPFPAFWGPGAGVDGHFKADQVSQWIAASAKWVEERHHPDLFLIYLPHLDYNLQRIGPKDPRIADDYRRIDSIVGDLINFFTAANVEPIVLSEYGISAVDRPIHLNRLFREKGWITIKDELGLELLDPGASRAFAVADHQAAHVYVNDPAILTAVRSTLEKIPGVAHVLDAPAKKGWGIDHERAGDLVVISDDRSWFTYYYWLDDETAPDFARTVDIHRKPGYDPVELFLDPKISMPKAKIAWRLLKKKLGFRMLMDLIPLDATLVKGSHGNRPADQQEYPLIIANSGLLPGKEIDSTDVYGIMKRAALG